MKPDYTQIENRQCLLHTLYGTHRAVTGDVIPASDNRHGRALVCVESIDSDHAILVYATVAAGKFEGERVPTFYAC